MANPDSLCSGRVISVCSDSLLRSTRQLVLSLRFVTISVATAAELRLFAGREIDVVILCHSLAPQELESAIQIALQQWKHAQVVVLTRVSTANALSSDNLVGTAAGPEFLLQSIDRLLPHLGVEHLSQQPMPDSDSFGRAAGTA